MRLRLLLQPFLTIVFPVLSFGSMISVLPFTPTLTVGQTLSVDVNVAGLSDLYAFQFDFFFDPTVLSAVSITEGSLFSSLGVSFDSGTIDNTAGAITFIADSLSGSGPGLSADGTLARFVFQGIGSGTSNLALSNAILLDSNFSDITASARNASVNVTASSVPEPRTFVLVLPFVLAIMALGLRRSERRCAAANR